LDPLELVGVVENVTGGFYVSRSLFGQIYAEALLEGEFLHILAYEEAYFIFFFF